MQTKYNNYNQNYLKTLVQELPVLNSIIFILS